jgi:ankyrin repeat protein
VKNAKSGEGGSTALLEKKNSVASMVTGGSTFREIRSLTKMRTRSELIQVNENSDSLLHVAAQQGRDDVVQFLIRRKGLDPHVVNQRGWT